MLEEIKNDVLHILLCLFAYKEKIQKDKSSYSCTEFTEELVSLNALAEIIVVRFSRIADKRSDVRSIKNLLKKEPSLNAKYKKEIEEFYSLAKCIVNRRNDSIAHMKPGILTIYPLQPLGKNTGDAVTSLVLLIDLFSGHKINYMWQPTSHCRKVDLRAELLSESS